MGTSEEDDRPTDDINRDIVTLLFILCMCDSINVVSDGQLLIINSV